MEIPSNLNTKENREEAERIADMLLKKPGAGKGTRYPEIMTDDKRRYRRRVEWPFFRSDENKPVFHWNNGQIPQQVS